MGLFLTAPFLLLVLVASGIVRAGERDFDSNGVKIRYLDEGEGTPVVLIHGWARDAQWMKKPLTKPHETLPGLASRYRVIALDCRGHGKSDKPHDTKLYGVEMVRDVVRLLDHLKIKKAHVVGYSMGSIISGKLLVDHPERLLSVTFGGGAPMFQPEQDSLDMFAAMADTVEQGKGIGPLLVFLTPPGQAPPTEQHIAQSAKWLADQDLRGLAGALRGLKDLEVTEAQLRASRVPVCFVNGSGEPEGLHQSIAKMFKLFPVEPTVRVIEGANHGDTFELPAFRKAILEFLAAPLDASAGAQSRPFASEEFDGFFDFDKALRDPAHPTRLKAQYDPGDHLHPNDAGQKVMAKCIDLSRFR